MEEETEFNNIMRHVGRDLTDAEKAAVKFVKDKALELWEAIHASGVSREVSLAKTKVEEAVMWVVKGLTA